MSIQAGGPMGNAISAASPLASLNTATSGQVSRSGSVGPIKGTNASSGTAVYGHPSMNLAYEVKKLM